MNSWRSGFMRWRMRDGPIGSHQELARAEKWESSSAETEEVECCRVMQEDENEGSRERLCWHVGLIAVDAAWSARRVGRMDVIL